MKNIMGKIIKSLYLTFAKLSFDYFSAAFEIFKVFSWRQNKT